MRSAWRATEPSPGTNSKMKSRCARALLSSAVLLMIACSNEIAAPQADTLGTSEEELLLAQLTNTTGLVSGPQLGMNTEANSSLRKKIDFHVKDLPPGFIVGPTYVIKPGAGLAGTSFISLVLNGTADALCEVNFQNITLKDAQGNVVASSLRHDHHLAVGSLKEVGGVYRSDCLRVGELGFVLHRWGYFPGAASTTEIFDRVEKAKASFSATVATVNASGAHATPNTYSVTNKWLTVSATNTGTGPLDAVGALRAAGGNFIALDNSGRPIAFGPLGTTFFDPKPRNVAPNANFDLTFTKPFTHPEGNLELLTNGSAQTLIVDIPAYPTGAVLQQLPATDLNFVRDVMVTDLQSSGFEATGGALLNPKLAGIQTVIETQLRPAAAAQNVELSSTECFFRSCALEATGTEADLLAFTQSNLENNPLSPVSYGSSWSSPIPVGNGTFRVITVIQTRSFLY
jgi:hypothetical protein